MENLKFILLPQKKLEDDILNKNFILKVIEKQETKKSLIFLQIDINYLSVAKVKISNLSLVIWNLI